MESKPSSIKIISIIILISSILLIFCNLSAFLIWAIMDVDASPPDSYEYKNYGDHLFNWMFENLDIMYFGLVIIGIILIPTSIYIKKYKKWALNLLSIILTFAIVNILTFFVSMIFSIYPNIEIKMFIIIPIVFALLFITPFVVFIVYLNKHSFKSHFV